MKKSMLAVATLSAAPGARANTPDQQFLNLVHSNGVGGQDDSLIAFAHQFCDTNGRVPIYLTVSGSA